MTTQWTRTRTHDTATADVTRLFAEHFGGVPAVVHSAPGRANVIGEHVDYAAGICLPFALEQRTYIAARANDLGTYRLVSRMQDSAGQESVSTAHVPTGEVGPGSPADWSGYVVGTIWAAIDNGTIPPLPAGTGLDLAIESDVPLGAGLSSSAALECAAGLAAWTLLTTHTTQPTLTDTIREGLMHAAIRAENDVVGASTGGLDQRTSLFATRAHALAIDFGRDEHYQVPFDLEAENLAILVTNTNAPHTLADGQYASRRAVIDGMTAFVQQRLGYASLRDADEAGQEMAVLCARWASENNQDANVVTDRVAHVTGEIRRTAQAIEFLQAGDMAALGHAMTASHASLRDLYQVSCPELDLAVDVALAAGALGSRMIGGGFGGSAIALVPVNHTDATASAIASAFAEAGFRAPEFLVARAGDGAV
ncbi:galactokinase [Corynebacterium sp. 320]|uniref:galactokinase n=1 Tax=Corynebacterium TaxID=1716 RepID=UPI00125CB797|nr:MULTISPECIES: galactokinase [Corynebacterium]KAB1503056.1 galactokinase [Corynebacterium sp. 320]KAB1550733.1 galactokinase [Corynebacterium sp. 321]KAB1551092.1 galactokinase [Corynebacterium sp. 319]KAB3526853.1 galactokinase [Corynebacterium sp. 250]KAB3538346.1 galactokinase [Corynebacterium sp. 366]